MNSNLFERKKFLDGNWMTRNISEYFSINTLNNNAIVKVNLLRATANEAEAFKKYLSRIPMECVKSTIIDLSYCNFVDSTFLSGIITFSKSHNTKIKLVVEDSRQLSIFKISKMDALFNIYSSLDQALSV
jgi:anti-anti-sigma regulatory factor